MTALPSVTDSTFAAEVDQADGLVLVDFGAEWCAPCRIVHPILEKLAGEYGDRLRVVTVDVDANPRTAARFGVRNLPTMLFMRDGKVVDQLIGALPRPAIQARIDANLAPAGTAS